MAYVPYGYTVKDGVITVDEKAAGQVKEFFEKYISGLSLTVAGEQAGIEKTHSSMGLILKNINYLGNDVYPEIIDKETFDKAEEVRNKRAKDLGRIAELAAFSAPPPIERFKMIKSEGKLPDDPVARAEYLYSLIESEV
ncbi:recombinase [Petrotoga sp. 8T1HF07.NaAc.6.1]|uniref:recombinase n=1 Tax=Petrotoga sp. 8T1HF07.NaAc.6.1 TaxID=1351838 RepID=UPI00192B56D3|nr:recombinase [Petrotoga sp. 8T1HF07.NaAc.6.1]MBL5980924.1 recombinase [Petrotoga sp. 8T1HF07.NaAc.6.1]